MADQVLIVHPDNIEAIAAAYEAAGMTVTRGPRSPEEYAAFFTKLVADRSPALVGIRRAPLSALAGLYYQQASQAYLVGLDLACVQVCLSACETVLRDAIHDACSTAARPDLIDAEVMGHMERMTLVPLAHCALKLGLISKEMRNHLVNEIAPFRNPFSHGNGTQLMRLAAGEGFTAEVKVTGIDLSDQGTEILDSKSRVLLAPIVEKVAKESSLPALRLVPRIHIEAAAQLAKFQRPRPFPAEYTEAHRKTSRAGKKKGGADASDEPDEI